MKVWRFFGGQPIDTHIDDHTNKGKEVIAMSNAVNFENINEPLQGHLALTTDPTQVCFVFILA